MKSPCTILDRIMVDVRREMATAQQRRPCEELERMIRDAPPVRPLAEALRPQFGLIAEIKARSPSHGPMRPANVAAAPGAYDQSGIVRAISVLTNRTHFGMSIERLREVKRRTTKPVLRKDFIFDEYQVYEARAFGADAVLLMANLLTPETLQRLLDLARALGMNALCECHTRAQIAAVPIAAEIYGINSRTFAVWESPAGAGRYARSRQLARHGVAKDLTTHWRRFALARYVPAHALKVAESGLRSDNIATLRDRWGYHAALVGTRLLAAPDGVEAELERFARALANSPPPAAAEGRSSANMRPPR